MKSVLKYIFISLLFLFACKSEKERSDQNNNPKLEITRDSLIIP